MLLIKGVIGSHSKWLLFVVTQLRKSEEFVALLVSIHSQFIYRHGNFIHWDFRENHWALSTQIVTVELITEFLVS